MAALRGDQYMALPSPSKALGMQRTGIPHSVPQGQDRDQVKEIVDALCRNHQQRAAAIVLLARATGMRLREAILADLPRLSRQAEACGKINIQEGTKGDRAGALVPRWIAVDDHIRDALGFASQASPAGSRNLKGFHELRAAYASERYEQITQHRAPINGGQCCQINKCLDHEARRQISYELGHGRIDVTAAYVGGRT